MATRNKYVTANDIYMRIISTFKSKGAEISKIEVVRWCSEVITDYLKDPVGLIEHKGASELIVDGVATMPTDIFKLQRVYGEDGSPCVNFMYQGDYLQFPDSYKAKKIFFDYYSLALDDVTGFPLIKKNYQPACYAYCVYKMYEEDATVIPPRVPQWRWLQIVQDKEWEIEAAHRSWDGLTDNEIMEIHNGLINRDYMKQVYGQRTHVLDGRESCDND